MRLLSINTRSLFDILFVFHIWLSILIILLFKCDSLFYLLLLVNTIFYVETMIFKSVLEIVILLL